MKLRLLPRRGIFASAVAASCLICVNPAHAEESRWAAPDDPTAKALIDWERQWAEAGCTNNGIERTILAEDFLGTSPHGSLSIFADAVSSVFWVSVAMTRSPSASRRSRVSAYWGRPGGARGTKWSER